MRAELTRCLRSRPDRGQIQNAATISLLSMPTLRRLTATELMSFSLIQDLNSLTAKAAETPAHTHTHTPQMRNAAVVSPSVFRCWLRDSTGVRQTDGLTLFDEVLIEEAVQDGG